MLRKVVKKADEFGKKLSESLSEENGVGGDENSVNPSATRRNAKIKKIYGSGLIAYTKLTSKMDKILDEHFALNDGKIISIGSHEDRGNLEPPNVPTPRNQQILRPRPLETLNDRQNQNFKTGHVEDDKFRIPALRPFSDFISNISSYSSPHRKAIGIRLRKNLLYYQTNYGMVTALIFLLLATNYSWKLVITGFIFTTIGIFVYSLKPMALMSQEFPFRLISSILIPLPLRYFLPFVFNSLAIFGFFIAVSVIPILIHAILRKNSCENAKGVASAKLQNTPMGSLLHKLNLLQ